MQNQVIDEGQVEPQTTQEMSETQSNEVVAETIVEIP
jgi:hypothetical protein